MSTGSTGSTELHYYQLGYIEPQTTQYLCLNYVNDDKSTTPYILCYNSIRKPDDSDYIYFYNLNDLITETNKLFINGNLTKITPNITLTNKDTPSIMTTQSFNNNPLKLFLSGTAADCNFGVDPSCSLDAFLLKLKEVPQTYVNYLSTDVKVNKVDVFENNDVKVKGYIQTGTDKTQTFSLNTQFSYIYTNEQYNNLTMSTEGIYYPIIFNNNPYSTLPSTPIPDVTGSISSSININGNSVFFLQVDNIYTKTVDSNGNIICSINDNYDVLTETDTWINTPNNVDIGYFQQALCEANIPVTGLTGDECVGTGACGTKDCFGGGCPNNGVCSQNMSDPTKYFCYDASRDNISGFIVDNFTKIILLIIALVVLLIIVLIFIFLRKKTLESFVIAAFLVLIIAVTIGFIFVNEWLYIFIGVSVLIFVTLGVEFALHNKNEYNNSN